MRPSSRNSKGALNRTLEACSRSRVPPLRLREGPGSHIAFDAHCPLWNSLQKRPKKSLAWDISWGKISSPNKMLYIMSSYAIHSIPIGSTKHSFKPPDGGFSFSILSKRWKGRRAPTQGAQCPHRPSGVSDTQPQVDDDNGGAGLRCTKGSHHSPRPGGSFARSAVRASTP